MSSIRKWSNVIEKALWNKDSLSTFFDHRGLIGHNREAQLAEMLRQFLPNYVTVGRGQIIDKDENRSKELDIVVARNDVFKLPILDTGANIYLVETVFAAFEIKSALNTTTLSSAIETLNSITELGLMVNLPDPRSDDKQALGEMLKDDEVAELEQFTDFVYPATYVYSYGPNEKKKFSSFDKMLLNSIMKTQVKPSSLPSVIARPGAVAVKNDGILLGPDCFREPWLYAMLEDSHPLYWILAHLLMRLQILSGQPKYMGLPISFRVESHLETPPTDWKLLSVQMRE